MDPVFGNFSQNPYAHLARFRDPLKISSVTWFSVTFRQTLQLLLIIRSKGIPMNPARSLEKLCPERLQTRFTYRFGLAGWKGVNIVTSLFWGQTGFFGFNLRRFPAA